MRKQWLVCMLSFLWLMSVPCYAADTVLTTGLKGNASDEYCTSLVNYYYSKLIAEKYVVLLKAAYPELQEGKPAESAPKAAAAGSADSKAADKEETQKDVSSYQKAKFKYEIAYAQSRSVHAILNFLYAQEHYIKEDSVTMGEFKKTSQNAMLAYKEFCEAAQEALHKKYGSDTYKMQEYFMPGNFTIGEVTKLNIFDFTATFLTEAFLKDLLKAVKTGSITPEEGAAKVSSMMTSIFAIKDKKLEGFKFWFNQLEFRSWNSIAE